LFGRPSPTRSEEPWSAKEAPRFEETLTFDFGDRPLKILCADDEEHCRKRLSAQLKRFGHDAVVVSDGDEALKAIVSDLKKFDVLITDNEMCRMNGLELVKKAKAVGFKGMIIVRSGFVEDDIREKYEALHVHAILSKLEPETNLQAALRG
jgi:CheY-like chemotaxis protein